MGAYLSLLRYSFYKIELGNILKWDYFKGYIVSIYKDFMEIGYVITSGLKYLHKPKKFYDHNATSEPLALAFIAYFYSFAIVFCIQLISFVPLKKGSITLAGMFFLLSLRFTPVFLMSFIYKKSTFIKKLLLSSYASAIYSSVGLLIPYILY